jgi:hypothetical protein
MSKTYELVELEQAVALRWLRHSLGQRATLSLAAIKPIEQCDGRSCGILPGDLDPELKLDFGGILGLDGGPANRAMAGVLKEAGTQGAACVVVEDDLREKGSANPDRNGSLIAAHCVPRRATRSLGGVERGRRRRGSGQDNEAGSQWISAECVRHVEKRTGTRTPRRSRRVRRHSERNCRLARSSDRWGIRWRIFCLLEAEMSQPGGLCAAVLGFVHRPSLSV